MAGSAVLIKPHANEGRMIRPRKAFPSPLGFIHSHLIHCGLSQTALPFSVLIYPRVASQAITRPCNPDRSPDLAGLRPVAFLSFLGT